MPARPDRRHHGGPGLIDGRLEILTPEGVRLALVPAGPGKRFLAWAVDMFVVLVAIFLAAWTMHLAGSEAAEGLFLVFLFVVWWGYPVLFEVFGKGATPGKRWLRLATVRDDGLPVGWRESLLRNLLLSADFLPFLFGTGLVCMALDAKFRRLGDIVAGTLVVHRETAQERMPTELAEPVDIPWTLAPEEQRALVDLQERLPALSEARADELGDLAEPLTGARGEKSLGILRGMASGLLR